MPDDLAKSRAEAAALLGLDVARPLCPADALRVDLVSTLRLTIDAASANVLEGGSADVGRLVGAVEQLQKLLPRASTEPEARRSDPRKALLELIMQQRERDGVPTEGISEVAALKAEIAALKAGGLTGRAAGLAVTPIDVVPPSEIGEFFRGAPRPGPDDHLAPPRTPTVIEGKATAAPAAKTSPTLDDVASAYSKPEEPWRSHLNRNFDPWADNR
jgi:hypothetical protein